MSDHEKRHEYSRAEISTRLIAFAEQTWRAPLSIAWDARASFAVEWRW